MKKKKNINRTPVKPQEYDADQILSDASDGKVLQAWAVILAAMAGFHETTREDIIELWDTTNSSVSMIQGFDGAEKAVRHFGQLIHKDIPFYRIHPKDINTRGDLVRFARKAAHNATYASLALIMEPMFREQLLDEKKLTTILHKAVLMNEEIADGEITVLDIQKMLLDEYGILLEKDGRNASLSIAEDKLHSK